MTQGHKEVFTFVITSQNSLHEIDELYFFKLISHEKLTKNLNSSPFLPELESAPIILLVVNDIFIYSVVKQNLGVILKPSLSFPTNL